MKYSSYISLFFILVSLSGCFLKDAYDISADHAIRVCNNGKYGILAECDMSKVHFYHEKPIWCRYDLPIDSLLEFYCIAPGGRLSIDEIPGLRKKGFNETDTLSVYIFNIDTLYKYSWEQIWAGDRFCVRYDLCKKEMEGNRIFYINYPPSESMKDIHMYPPYDTVIERENNY